MHDLMAVATQKLHAECHPRRPHPRNQDEENFNLFSDLTNIPKDILKELNSQRHQPELCDVRITTNDGGSFRAHKSVLSSCSQYLKNKLSFRDADEDTGKESEAVIHLGMVSSKSCDILLELLYTSKLSLTRENAAEVLLAAQVLDLQPVLALCRQFLRSDVVSKIVRKETEEPIADPFEAERSYVRGGRDREARIDQFFQDSKAGIAKKSSLKDFQTDSHSLDNGEGPKDRIKNFNGPRAKKILQRPSSLSNLPPHYILTPNNFRPLSAPTLYSTCIDDISTVSPTPDYDIAPLDLSKTDANIPETPHQSKDEIFTAQPESSIRFKLQSEVQYLPQSNKYYNFPTASVGYTDPRFYGNHSQDGISRISPLTNRRTFTEAFSSNRAGDDNENESQRHKVGKLQASTPKPNDLPQYYNLAGLHPQVPDLWAYLMQSETANPAYRYGTDKDLIAQRYQSFLFNELHCSNTTAPPPLLTCKLCGLESASEWQLLMHLRFRHYAGYIAPPNPLQFEPREESYYDKINLTKVPTTQAKVTFERPQHINEIMNNHEEERAKTSMILTTNDVTAKVRHKCYHCKKEFDSIFLLRKHKSMEHVKRPHRCHFCQAAFPNKAGLSVHLRSHTGERPYQCKICNKSFTQLGHVQRHQKVHTGEKPYQCPLCQARVRDKASMHYHLLAHQGVKPYHCDQCDARFTKRSSLVKHKNVHTGSHLYQCSQCKASFREKASLSRHVRSQHKDSFLPKSVKIFDNSN